jgi:hypothetical protein
MNVTVNQIRQEMTSLVQAHEMVNSFFWGDFHRAYNEKDQFYPLVCSYLSDGAINPNLTQMQLVVIVCDKTFKGLENLNDTESDTVTVARHLYNVIKQSPRWNALLRVNSSTFTKFYENTSDEVAGVILTMNVDVKQSRSLCDLPLDNYDFDGTFVGAECEPVLIVNSNQSFSFNAPSGTIVELPDTPVTVFDQNGNELGSSSVPSVTGGNINVISVPCADANYVVEYADGTPIESGTIPSGGYVMVIVPNPEPVTWTLFDTDGNILDSGNEPAGGVLTIVAPDATFSINGTQVATIPSGGSDSIQVRKASGSDQIGALQGQHWRIPNSQITLKDTANNTLSTTSVPATESAQIVAPDGTVTVNRDGVFFATQPVRSGGVATVNVESTANKLPTKSGQTVSYATGDDGDDQRARETSFFHLTNNNPFGNNRRFTGTTGGYHVNSDNTFRDKEGNITTKALAFPNDIMLDWAYYNGDNLSGQVMMWYIIDAGNITPASDREWIPINNAIVGLNVGGLTGWKMPNTLEFSIILFKNDVNNFFFNYEPFAVNGGRNYWTNETSNLNTANAIRFQTGTANYLITQAKTTQAAATRIMAVRYGNYSVTGGNVIIS